MSDFTSELVSLLLRHNVYFADQGDDAYFYTPTDDGGAMVLDGPTLIGRLADARAHACRTCAHWTPRADGKDVGNCAEVMTRLSLPRFTTNDFDVCPHWQEKENNV